MQAKHPQKKFRTDSLTITTSPSFDALNLFQYIKNKFNFPCIWLKQPSITKKEEVLTYIAHKPIGFLKLKNTTEVQYSSNSISSSFRYFQREIVINKIPVFSQTIKIKV